MDTVVWEDRYDTGIEIIDNQHRTIIDQIDRLQHAPLNNEREALRLSLQDMRQYVIDHFRFEEELMREAEYKYLRPHAAAHQRFIDRLDKMALSHNEGSLKSCEMTVFLKEWLIRHIGHEDQDYVPDVMRIMNGICQ